MYMGQGFGCCFPQEDTRVATVQVGDAEPAMPDNQPSRTCKTLPFW